ncbi:MAG: hypothetical protein EXS48_00045 [Candidatus Staskawiczbacteria bacterium]|nr:hypothetical protein [Candidatus Staskawiczbacteria bacterium]
MLAKLPEDKVLFSQALETDKEKVQKLCVNIEMMCCAYSKNQHRQLMLYKRENAYGRQEAGIAYLPGPKCTASKLFAREMLRLFSKDPNYCFDFAEKYYFDLVSAKNYLSPHS